MDSLLKDLKQWVETTEDTPMDVIKKELIQSHWGVHTWDDLGKELMSESMKSSTAHKEWSEQYWTEERREQQRQIALETTKNRKKYKRRNQYMNGAVMSEETRQKKRDALLGRKWFNDGVKTYFRHTPEKGWVEGRLRKNS